MRLHEQEAQPQSVSAEVRNFNWLLENFVDTTAGVTDAVAVSSDGLLMAMSSTLERAGAEQLAAIIAGMNSLGESTARCFALGGLDRLCNGFHVQRPFFRVLLSSHLPGHAALSSTRQMTQPKRGSLKSA